jgi:hypothetical protein
MRYRVRVTLNSKTRRRRLGAMCSLAALVMLIANEIVPGERLDGVAFVIYWGVCFGFAVLAMLVGILDAHALRREARAEQRALLEDALEDIQAEKDARNRTSRHPESPGSN